MDFEIAGREDGTAVAGHAVAVESGSVDRQNAGVEKGAAVDLGLWFFLTPPPLTMLIGAAVTAVALYIYYIVYRRKNRALQSQRAQLLSDIQTYSHLQ